MFAPVALGVVLAVTPHPKHNLRQIVYQMQFLQKRRLLDSLDKSDAPELCRLLPSIKAPWVYQDCAEQLRTWRYMPSIQLLVDSLKLDLWNPRSHRLAAESALLDWGWVAFGPLSRAIRSGTDRQKLACLRIFVTQDRMFPADRILSRVFLECSKSEITEMRNLAVSGLYAHSGRIDHWMEGIHPSTLDNPVTFERLMQMMADEDKGVSETAMKDVYEWLWSRHMNMFRMPDNWNYGRLDKVDERKSLSTLIQSASDPYERAAAVALLWKKYGQAVEHIQALNDVSALVRRTSLYFMRDGVKTEFFTDLQKLAHSPLVDTRLAAAQALGTSYLLESLPELRKLAEDPSPAVRAAAQRALKNLKNSVESRTGR